MLYTRYTHTSLSYGYTANESPCSVNCSQVHQGLMIVATARHGLLGSSPMLSALTRSVWLSAAAAIIASLMTARQRRHSGQPRSYSRQVGSQLSAQACVALHVGHDRAVHVAYPNLKVLQPSSCAIFDKQRMRNIITMTSAMQLEAD